MTAPSPDTLAAVDLGSNSFHMVVAHLLDGQWRMVDRLRDQVQLAAGLGADGRLNERALQRGKESLRRFRERLRGIPAERIRAVGTNTLRQMRNGRQVRAQFERALGSPIEIISGREEARLIYLGVAHDLANGSGRRLVVDIGGGSTECILGEQFEATDVDSLHMGCVSYSRRFFPRGRMDKKAFDAARTAAELELHALAHHYRAVGWESCVGASGTIKAIDAVVREAGWSQAGITPKALRKLIKTMLQYRSASGLKALPGLEPNRAPVLPGGVAILSAIFDVFGVEHMRAADGALREGVLYDLQGRLRHEDVRERTVQRLIERFHVDWEQAARIENTALRILEQLGEAWALPWEESRQYLRWAVRLHTIGLAVAYSGYHKHGAYLVANADMPGFSREDQLVLAAMIRAHRRKLTTKIFADVPSERRRRTMRLAVIMRLAVQLHRSHHDDAMPATMQASIAEQTLRVRLPKTWWRRHPLTRADLETEIPKLANLGVDLVIE